MKLLVIIIILNAGVLHLNASCPHSCRCTQKENSVIVDCSRLNLNVLPKDIPSHTTHLVLKQNTFTTIRADYFNHHSSLLELDLSNSDIEFIEEGSFRSLENLTKLQLSYNKLSNISGDIFAPLKKLRRLFLSGNHLSEIPALYLPELRTLNLDNNALITAIFPEKFRNCPILHRIILTNNKIAEIGENDFRHLEKSRVALLYLKYNKIDHIHPRAFSILSKSLTSLSLDGNEKLGDAGVMNVIQSLRNSTRLGNLSLKKVGLTKLVENIFDPLTSVAVRSLYLDANNLQRFDESVFSKLLHLDALSMSNCGLTSGHVENLFHTTLRQLFLNFNNLQQVPELHLSNLVKLSLKQNDIREILAGKLSGLQRLKMLDLESNSIVEISPSSFLDLNALSVLNLRQNRIRILETGSLVGLRNLQRLDLSRQTPGLKDLQNDALSLPSLDYLDLQSNHIGVTLRKSEASPFVRLPQLRVLQLDKNLLTGTLKWTALKGLHNLQHLHLARNRLRAWETGSLPDKLRTLDLSANMISSFKNIPAENDVYSLIGLAKLNLRHNPFSCTCEDLSNFVTWRQVNRQSASPVQLIDLNLYSCNWPVGLRNRTLSRVTLADVGCPNTPRIYQGMTADTTGTITFRDNDKFQRQEWMQQYYGISGGIIALLFLVVIVLGVICYFRRRTRTPRDVTSNGEISSHRHASSDLKHNRHEAVPLALNGEAILVDETRAGRSPAANENV